MGLDSHAEQNDAFHSTAQHSTAQHSTAQHSTAQLSALFFRIKLYIFVMDNRLT